MPRTISISTSISLSMCPRCWRSSITVDLRSLDLRIGRETATLGDVIVSAYSCGATFGSPGQSLLANLFWLDLWKSNLRQVLVVTFMPGFRLQQPGVGTATTPPLTF